jgi:hypothetical protein
MQTLISGTPLMCDLLDDYGGRAVEILQRFLDQLAAGPAELSSDDLDELEEIHAEFQAITGGVQALVLEIPLGELLQLYRHE